MNGQNPLEGKSCSQAHRITLKKYPDVLNINQMCEILGVSVKTGYSLLKSKKIASLKVGRSYRIPKTHLVSYLKAGCKKN